MFQKLTKSDWKILEFFIDNYNSSFYLRELAKQLNLSPSVIKRSVDKLIKFSLIIENNRANLRLFSYNLENITAKYLKITKNLEYLKPLISKIEAISIVLFGSYAKGENTKQSDIDLLIISTKGVRLPTIFKDKKIQIIKRTPSEWKKLKDKEKGFYNEIISTGIVLKGEMPL